MPAPAELAHNERGDVRLDYEISGKKQIRLWEPKPVGTLETSFREDGVILLQRSIETSAIKDRIGETLAEAEIHSTKEVPFRGVLFDKACPWCAKHTLVRFSEAYRSRNEVPIVPLYYCRECRNKGYYLADEYLLHLIESNPQLFEEADLQKFKSNRDAFISEIKAHVISSFASKKVRRIV